MNLKKKYDFDEPPSGSDETPFSDDEQKIYFYAHTEKGRQNADLFSVQLIFPTVQIIQPQTFFGTDENPFGIIVVWNDLYDLYRFVRFDFRFARRPMVLPVRALLFYSPYC